MPTYTLKARFIFCSAFFFSAGLLSLLVQPLLAGPAAAGLEVNTLPILWEAGGLSAGIESAGQGMRIAADSIGNVAIVSGPSMGTDLAVTSYTSNGSFRWMRSISPDSGIFLADWVVAVSNGDFVAAGHSISPSSGIPIAIAMVRYGPDGTYQWRVDIQGLLPNIGRVVSDSDGNTYLAFNAIGDGQDIILHKYDPAGSLLWSEVISTGFLSNNIATSLALSPDESEIALTGDTLGGAEWITALYATSSGARKWLVTAPEGVATHDVLVDHERVYVTGLGNVGISAFLTVVAYDRSTGTRLWRTDKMASDATSAAGLRLAFAPDGSLVVAGQALRGFLDWYIVGMETDGTVRWEAVRDGGLNTDEVPGGVLTLADGTTVVSGSGGPNLPGGYIPGVTAGYGSDGTLLWEAFARLPSTWVTALPNGVVCASGGYDALITCWQTPFSTFSNWLPIILRAP